MLFLILFLTHYIRFIEYSINFDIDEIFIQFFFRP